MLFALQRSLKLLLVLDLVFFLDVVNDAAELFVAQRVAKLAAALHDDHLVDDVDHDLRRDFVQRLAQLLVGRIGLEIDLLPALPQHLDLPLLEIGLGEYLAVHFDENLLDDFGARRCSQRQEACERQNCHFHKWLRINILNLIEQIAQ